MKLWAVGMRNAILGNDLNLRNKYHLPIFPWCSLYKELERKNSVGIGLKIQIDGFELAVANSKASVGNLCVPSVKLADSPNQHKAAVL